MFVLCEISYKLVRKTAYFINETFEIKNKIYEIHAFIGFQCFLYLHLMINVIYVRCLDL